MTNTQKVVLIPALGLLVLLGGAFIGYAQLSNAETVYGGRMMHGMMGMHKNHHGVHGVVTSIDGTTFTLKTVDGTSFTVKAGDATIQKFEKGEGPVGISLSDLEVGDSVGVRGEIDGTVVTATAVMSGSGEKGMGMHGHRGGHGVLGEVTAINGTTITLKSLDGTTYTITASDATVSRVIEGSIADIAVGDRIGTHGTVEGTTITAKHIMDDVKEFTQNE